MNLSVGTMVVRVVIVVVAADMARMSKVLFVDGEKERGVMQCAISEVALPRNI
jgi:hypothetical protein